MENPTNKCQDRMAHVLRLSDEDFKSSLTSKRNTLKRKEGSLSKETEDRKKSQKGILDLKTQKLTYIYI